MKSNFITENNVKKKATGRILQESETIDDHIIQASSIKEWLDISIFSDAEIEMLQRAEEKKQRAIGVGLGIKDVEVLIEQRRRWMKEDSLLFDGSDTEHLSEMEVVAWDQISNKC